MAKTAAYIGAIYLRETAVPTGKYCKDIKKRLIAVIPAKALKTINLLLLPKMGIPLIKI